MGWIDPMAVVTYFYPEDTPLRRLLLRHSTQVRDKALAMLAHTCLPVDAQLVATGAMLHDIGIGACRAPKILCTGSEPYMTHGIIGARMLREYGAAHGIDLEACARVCERHTGSGITAAEVRMQQLPLPERDYLPETGEEKLICVADKFFSKSGDMREKTVDSIRREMEKFGPEPLARFDAMYRLFADE